MHPYTLAEPGPQLREEIETTLKGLDERPALKVALVRAWGSSLAASEYERLADVPFSTSSDYPLVSHVNEVVLGGLDLARRAADFWSESADMDVLVPALVLHDVDKPLMTVRREGKVEASHWSRELPHGVIGAMIAKDCGFPHEVVGIVATHSSVSPFHGKSLEAYILHYADFFSADHALMAAGKEPFYQRHWK